MKTFRLREMRIINKHSRRRLTSCQDQGSPRHIWYDVPASISQSDICRLHERVHTNNFKNAFVLSTSHMLTVLRGSYVGFSSHFHLRSLTY